MKLNSSTAVDRISKLALLGTTALVASFGLMSNAYAQDSTETTTEDTDEVISTGIRQSLKDARDLKRNADTAIDSITASDVGALPDLSVAEALQRIPGVVVQRFDVSDNNAGDFPSPEGGGNLIRGLTLVRSEFNGRDTFSANGGRALDFGTIPPELIGAVDVYKNTSADLIEGGIGGSINLRTLEPFDRDGLTAVVTADGTYTDLRDEWAPDFSALLGNRWDTDMGEFGLLGSFSSSELKSDLHGFQIGPLSPIPVGNTRIAVPSGFQLRTNDVDRKRDSYYVAGQWRDPSGDLQLTAKYSLIENDVNSNERTLEFFPDGESWGDPANPPPALSGDSLTQLVGDFTSSPFVSSGIAACNGSNDPNRELSLCETTFPVTGIYQSGLITNRLRDWAGTDFQPILRGAPFTNLGINQIDKSKTDDLSLNVKWRPSDRLYVNLDAHKTTAEFERQRLWVGSRFQSNFTLNADLDNPSVTLVQDPTNDPLRRGGARGPLTGGLDDPNNVFLKFAADEFADNEGDLYAVRGDVEYEFDNDGWFDKVKFGARYADREQINRAAGLNWAAVAPVWAGGYLPFADLQNPTFEVVDFSDFQRGGVVRGDNTSVIFADRNLIQNYSAFVDAISGDPLVPVNNRPDLGPGVVAYSDWAPLFNNGTNAPNGVDYLNRGQIGDVREKTQNYYARLDFGNEFNNGMSVEGNVGIRYTKADIEANGSFVYNEVANNNAAGQNPIDFSPEAVAFLAQADEDRSGPIGSEDFWLPSLNVKWNLNDETLVRFAASKAITRPRIDQLRADQSAGGAFAFATNNDPAVPPDQRITDIALTQINVFGGNPNLKAIEANNFDLSIEHYYGDNNSLTLSLFKKDIKNNIIYGTQTIDTVTLDGRTVPVVFSGDVNQDEAKIHGFEVAYQQFFDDWPGLLGNLGVQANYTFIDAETNAPLPVVDADGDGVPDSFEQIFRFGVDNFLGLSDHAANLIGIYQDDKLEMRLAYNWRSEYLSSYRDFVTGNPIFQTDRGYLDGSIKYNVTENFQLRAQVANILDTRANAEQQIDASGQRFGRTSFIGDRRIRIGARYQF